MKIDKLDFIRISKFNFPKDAVKKKNKQIINQKKIFSILRSKKKDLYPEYIKNFLQF